MRKWTAQKLKKVWCQERKDLPAAVELGQFNGFITGNQATGSISVRQWVDILVCDAILER